jgi:hypothetical protein
MSLLHYEEAAPWANAIKLMVLERRMPPWLPEEGALHWRGARSLTAPELDLLVEWASGGTPRGAGSEGEALSSAEGGSARGPGSAGEADSGGRAASTAQRQEPAADLVWSAGQETVLGPEEVERMVCVVFPRHEGKDRLLAAIELRPRNESIVRSAVVRRGDTCNEEDQPLATWLPGDRAFAIPDGASEVLRRGDALSARILYRKTWTLLGKAAREQSRLALYFAKAPSATLSHLNLAPGGGTTFRAAARLVAVFPRGVRGETLRLEAIRPGGEREEVLVIERFDPAWSAKYVLQEPLSLPAGARLEAVGGGFWLDYRTGEAAPLKARQRPGAPAGSP